MPAEGKVLATAHDVARVAGVSQATVSRVLNDHPAVRPSTRERVLAALAATGYQPNLAARTMRTNRTGTIGLVVDDVTNPFYPELVKAISAQLGQAGLRMVLWDSAGAGEQGAIEAIDQRLIDGLVFTTATRRSRALQQAVRRGSPLVLVNRTVSGLPCDRVDSDNRTRAREVARVFAEAGHRRVAFIGAGTEASTVVAREAGFRAGCRAHGLDLTVADGMFTHDGGQAAMAQLLPGRPTAVFCANDFSALGALDELRRQRIRVPEDVWVVGYDDIAMAAWESFGLTTVRQPVPEMAEAAIALLRRRLAEPEAPAVHKRLPGRLIRRRSTT